MRRGWEEWFARLDEWGAADATHREIARWVAAQQGVEPLAWNAQAVAGSYELARGLRVVGEKSDGFAITISKTVGRQPDAGQRQLPGERRDEEHRLARAQATGRR